MAPAAVTTNGSDAGKVSSAEIALARSQIKHVGIIGSGQMGSGIAHVAALAGYNVLIHDIATERIEKGISEIGKNMARQVARGRISEDERQAAMARLAVAGTVGDLGAADLVIEAATEDEEVKRKIFIGLCPSLKPTAILATNTSSISITRLAAVTDRAEHFIGMHFMNPVPVMELVELIRGIATDDQTFPLSRGFAESLGKQIAVSEDFPAFIVNRILLPMINEAIYTLMEGVGGVEAIDRAMRLGANHPMGPLELADFIGLDTCLQRDAGAVRGPFGFEIPAVPAAGEVRRRRLARQQDQARLLRLSRRSAGTDTVERIDGADQPKASSAAAVATADDAFGLSALPHA